MAIAAKPMSDVTGQTGNTAMSHANSEALIVDCAGPEEFILEEREEISVGAPYPGAVAVPSEAPMDEDAVAWAIAKAGDLRPSDAVKIVRELQSGGWVILRMSSPG